MQVKVLFFATLRDKAGTRSADLELPEGTTIAQLKTILSEKFTAMTPQVMDHCLASIDHEYRFDDTVINDGAEIALFPPVSGG